jgi:hypothetical protein
MLFQNFYLLVLLSVTCSVSAFEGATDKKIIKSLLKLLVDIHHGVEPLDNTSAPVSRRSGERGPNDYMYFVPFEVKHRSMAPFIDGKSMLLLSGVNQSLHDVYQTTIFYALRKFCPYFWTEDSLLNKFFFTLISDHFPLSESRESPTFQDELELLTLKFNFSSEPFSPIPRNILYYLLCFLHELTYGLDSPVPYNMIHGKVHFIKHLRQSDLPMSLEYFFNMIDHKSQLETDDDVVLNAYISNVHFFNAKPDSNMIRTRFNIHILSSQVIRDLSLNAEFTVAIIEILAPEINVDLHDALSFLVKYNSFSRSIFDRIPSNPDIMFHVQDFRFFKARFLRMAVDYPNSRDNWFQQIYTVDYLNQFSLESFEALGKKMLGSELRKIAGINSLTLANLDMFCQMINSDFLFNPLELNKVLHDVFIRSNTLMFEVLIKETSRPLSVFYTFNSDTLFSIFPTGSMFPSKEFLKLFVDFLSTRDPFLFLLMNELLLESFKPFIQDKFDLNCRFMLNLSPMHFPLFQTFIQFNESFSFKQIINSLNRDDIKSVFASDISVFDYDIVNVDYPVLQINRDNLPPIFY